MLDRAAILRHIDHILLDAIHSSPHTTPIKLNNPNTYGYKRYLRGTWKFGGDSDDEGEDRGKDDEEEILVDIIKRDGHILYRTERMI